MQLPNFRINYHVVEFRIIFIVMMSTTVYVIPVDVRK